MSHVIVALLRHGSYEQPEGVPSAHLPYALNDAGIEQARSGARQVASFAKEAGLTIDVVVDSSSLRRAWQTADILSATLSDTLGQRFSVQCFDALCERSVGAMANLTVTQIEAITAADPRTPALPAGWKRDPHYVLPYVGAESLLAAGARAAQHIETRTAIHPERPMLKIFVGHGGAFRHAAFHLGLLQREELSKLSMHHATPVFITRTNATWTHVDGEWKSRQAREAID